ncbi:MAG: hypothetical protein QNJ14_14090 [Woeseiaceae bacterium]|nr:hypothetical protein [Woeseiaceae bacterium]
MNEDTANLRVLLAITETSPLDRLWQSLVDQISGASAEVVTILVSDDSWRRAASLPFTREFSRISGVQDDFTHRRAEQIRQDTAGRARRRLERLAADAELEIVFEVVSEDEDTHVQTIVTVRRDILIAPTVLEDKPLFAELARRHRQVVLVEVDNDRS